MERHWEVPHDEHQALLDEHQALGPGEAARFKGADVDSGREIPAGFIFPVP